MKDIIDEHACVKLEKTVAEVLTENNLQAVLYFSKIQKHWTIIVGKPLAAKTSPVQLSQSRLVVCVEDAAYSHHLKYFEKNILDLIASPEICGEGVVTKVVFKVGKQALTKPDQDVSASGAPALCQPHAVDTKAVETAATIEDRKLKASFTRLMSQRVGKSSDSSS